MLNYSSELLDGSGTEFGGDTAGGGDAAPGAVV